MPSGCPREALARDNRERESAQGLFETVAIQPRDYLASDDYQRAPDQIGFLRHQPESLLGGQRLAPQAHRFERGALRVQKIARVAPLEQFPEFGQIERVFGVVALFKFYLEIIAQETSCVATGSSGRFPEQACFLHGELSCPKHLAQRPQTSLLDAAFGRA